MDKVTLMFPGFRTKAFTLSFDDGLDTDIRLAGVMKKYGIKGTFNVNSGLFSPEGTVKPAGRDSIPLTVSQAKELFSDPDFEVASHGYRHIALGHTGGADAMMDVLNDRITLERTFGRLVRGFAVPYSSYNDDVRTMVRLAGFAWARGGGRKTDFLLPREDEWYDWTGIGQLDGAVDDLIDRFVGEPNLYYHGQLLMLYGHSYEFENIDGLWEKAEERFRKLVSCEEIWFATNSEIHEYVRAFRGLVYYADMSAAYNPARVDVFLRCDDGKFRIPAGKEAKN